jgi:hypothetical protein
MALGSHKDGTRLSKNEAYQTYNNLIKILQFRYCYILFNGFTSTLKARHQHPVFKFEVIADIQYADKKDTKTRFNKSAINRLDS